MTGQPLNLNVALFIDADNAPSRKLGDVLAELASLGSVSIRRACRRCVCAGRSRCQK